MFIEKEKFYYVEEFMKLGIIAVYTKKNMGNMSDFCKLENERTDIQKNNRDKLLEELNLNGKNQVFSFQTHSNNVKDIEMDTDKYVYEKENNIDGFITKRKDVVLFTFYADCLPIFVYDKINKVIGVWHSGWQGSYNEIMKNGIELMKKKYGTREENILMALGIGIGGEDYEVGLDFYEKFKSKFGSENEAIKNSFLFNKKILKYNFDNIKFNEEMALNIGIKKENLIISRESTYNKKFHSYRREGKESGRATGIIAFNDNFLEI